MNASLRKLGTLFAKDACDLIKNPSMLVVCLLPVAFILLYGYAFADLGSSATEAATTEEDRQTVSTTFNYMKLIIALCMSIGMTGTMTLIYGIAEEKEKHTLRTLMLANVSGGQILTAKCLVSLLAIVVVETLCFVASGSDASLLASYLAVGVLGALPIVLLSLTLGLASRDQMTAGLYSVPILLVAMLPMLAFYGEDIATVAAYAPTGGMDTLLHLIVEGSFTWGDATLPLAVTLAWVLVGVGVCLAFCKRLLRDN